MNFINKLWFYHYIAYIGKILKYTNYWVDVMKTRINSVW